MTTYLHFCLITKTILCSSSNTIDLRTHKIGAPAELMQWQKNVLKGIVVQFLTMTFHVFRFISLETDDCRSCTFVRPCYTNNGTIKCLKTSFRTRKRWQRISHHFVENLFRNVVLEELYSFRHISSKEKLFAALPTELIRDKFMTFQIEKFQFSLSALERRFSFVFYT